MVLADKYLLRKNAMVQIVGGIVGQDPTVWGADGGEFNPYRFLVHGKSGSTAGVGRAAAPLPDGIPSAAFRAFGGGTVICPGRHFAQTELMVFAAYMALVFDLSDINGGPIQVPAKDETGIPLTVLKPTKQPIVRMKRRRSWEHIRLRIEGA
jgi:cytochrome P450